MPKLDNTTKRVSLPTQAKAVKHGSLLRELAFKNMEEAQKVHANNHFRNNMLIAQRMKNFTMERDRINGIIHDDRLVNNRDKRQLGVRQHVLQSHLNYYEPIFGVQGHYKHL